MKPPLKISVITVTYNAANLIARTIGSVEEQTYAAVEHIIIDGNSQDSTLSEIHHYQERNSRTEHPREIVCRSEPDRGIYDAMNKGLELATGKYLLFLNAGDRFHTPDTLAQIAAVAEKGDKLPAVIYGDTHIVDAAGNFLHRRRLSPPPSLTWRSFQSGMLVCHQAFFARRDIAQKTPYDLHFRFSADFDWCIRVMRAAHRRKLPLANAGLVVADYLNEGTTTRHHKASLRERFRIMEKYYGLMPTLAYHLWFLVRNFIKK